jgi:hydrogenase nickel incorporation protein HypB
VPQSRQKGKRVIITPDEGERLNHHASHHHGPAAVEPVNIELQEDFMERNRKLAEQNLAMFDRHQIRAINILGSVGSGKTSLIEAIVKRLANRRDEMLVIAGDVTTTIDADRIAQHKVRSIQVNTGVECHLDARLIQKALASADLSKTKIVIIENVGNLICPADFPLGAHQRVVVVSVTEGPWMIQKHPVIFYESDLVVINKIDLADAMGVDVDELERDAKRIKPSLIVLRTSVRNGIGVDEVIQHLGLEPAPRR